MKQNTDEWKEFRKSKIGASDAPVILQVSPFKTPYQLWMEKIGLEDDLVLNSAIIRLAEMEEKARHKFMKYTGIPVFPTVCTSITHDWMIASLDGISLDGRFAVEIKCPGNKDQELAKNGGIPIKYYPQLQHQLSVTGLDGMFYYSFDGTEGVIIEVKRDQKYIDNMIEKESEFYRCMMNFEAPKLTNKDFTPRNDQEWVSIASEYKQVKFDLSTLLKKESELKERLILMSANQNSQGGGIRIQKLARKGSVDYSKIPELENIDLESFRRDNTSYWKIAEVQTV